MTFATHLHRRPILAVLLVMLAWTTNLPAQTRASAKLLPVELGPIPTDGLGFLYLRPAEVWNSEIVAKIRQLYPREFGNFNGGGADDPAGIESLSMVMASADGMGTFFGSSPRRTGPKGLPLDPDKKADDGPDEPLREMAIFTTIKPFERAKVFQMMLGDGSEQRTHKDKIYYVPSDRQGFRENALYLLNDRTFITVAPVVAMKKVLERLDQAKVPGPLSPALELARIKHHLVYAMNLNEPSFKKARPSILDGMSRGGRMEEPNWAFVPLLDASLATVTIDVDKGVRAQGNFTFTSTELAAEGADAIRDALFLARIFGMTRSAHSLRAQARESNNPLDSLFFAAMARHAETCLREAVVEQRQEKVQVLVTGDFNVNALRAQAQAEIKAMAKDQESRLAKTRRQSADNLVDIAFALQAHHDAHKFLPPAAICSKHDGKQLLSWRVAILPYLGEEALFKQFKLDEPWDSPNNIKLLAKMPKVYTPVDDRNAFRRRSERMNPNDQFGTYYQVFAGPGAAFETFVDKNSYLGATGTTIPKSFPDGISFTIAVAEAPTAVPWTKPADLVYDKKQPLPALGGGMFEDGFHIIFMDCSPPRFLSSNIDPGTLRALITRDGNEAIDWAKVK